MTTVIRLIFSPAGRFFVGLLVVLAMLIWLNRTAYNRGYAAAEAAQAAEIAEMQARYDAAVVKTQAQARDLENYREAQRINAMEIEDEARADPAAGGRLPSDDSLRRLKRRWGAAH